MIWLIWLTALVFFPWPDALSGPVRVAIWILPPLVAEPLLVATRRASLGQSMRGLRVEALPGYAFPALPALIARHISKLVFFGLSLLYVPFSPRSQAIHDRLFGTVVVRTGMAQPAIAPRPAQGSFRRFFAALVWVTIGNIVGLFALALIVAVFFPEVLDATGDEGRVLDGALNVVLLILEGGILYLAFSGRLPGTRPSVERGTAQQSVSGLPGSS